MHRAVRHQPLVHADRGAGGERERLQHLGHPGQAEIRRRGERSAERAGGGRRRRLIRHAQTRKTEQEHAGIDNGYDGTHGTRRPQRARHPARLAPLCLFDQPQGHRHDVPGVCADRRPGRRRDVDPDPRRADVSGPADLPRDALLRRGGHRARAGDDLLRDHAGDDRRVRQLDDPADDRLARYGVPAHEQHFVLAVAGVVRPVRRLVPVRGRAGDIGRRTPAGRCMRRCRPTAIPDRPWISSSCRSISPAPRRSSAPSTSSPPSSTCARRA